MERRPAPRILLVEADPAMAAATLETLRGAGHACRRLATRTTVLTAFDGDRFDCLIVGQTPADISNPELVTAARARFGYGMPVIGLAPEGGMKAVIGALDAGMDDCLMRPVPPALLIAQIRAAMRRATPDGPRVEACVGHLRFQPEGFKVFVAGEMVTLTAKEYALALMLCRSLGMPLGRDHILGTIWGDDVAPLTRTLDVHVSRLRNKLDLRPERGFRLSALYGRGYRLDYTDATPAPVHKTATIIRRRSASPSALPAA